MSLLLNECATPPQYLTPLNREFTYDSEAMANVSSTNTDNWIVPVDSITVAGKTIASRAMEPNQSLEAWIDTGMCSRVALLEHH